MRICYAIFAGISLRSFRITFAAYLPTHIKSLRDFFQTKGTVLLVCLWHIQTKRTVPLVCGLRQRLESATPHHQRRSPQRGRWHRQKDKNRSPSAKNQTRKGRDTSRPPIIVVSYWISTICRGREVSRPYHAKSFGKFDTTSFQEFILSPGVFRRERRAVFILGAMW